MLHRSSCAIVPHCEPGPTRERRRRNNPAACGGGCTTHAQKRNGYTTKRSSPDWCPLRMPYRLPFPFESLRLLSCFFVVVRTMKKRKGGTNAFPGPEVSCLVRCGGVEYTESMGGAPIHVERRESICPARQRRLKQVKRIRGQREKSREQDEKVEEGRKSLYMHHRESQPEESEQTLSHLYLVHYYTCSTFTNK